ncbi:hypothetical protein AFCDBAGC_1045 [Methylobacterium cerastii]|uniref:Uncharacterized protein n=1 Tax=Methylobacterium cerastii TaxID=932741 RepID=A0ABQ4QDF1_9HYPH|nr:hypothetical protein [Methylobacterium cerastii]GJD43198.1 hypothetical protein AFCDBAGC_1045 [Methylobacterium cerastii]
MTYAWSMTDGDHADDGYTADDLQPHGWSPGGYVGTCKVCGGRAFGAKRVRCCRSCAVRALEAERAKPPVVERREFWWITSERWGHPNQTPAEIIFRDDVASQVFAVGADEIYRAEDCVLIERVLPAGHAAAAVEKLQAASFNTGCPRTGYVIDEAIELLQGGLPV